MQITATQRITNADGEPLFSPYVWQIRVGAMPSSGTLVERPDARLRKPRSTGDLDRDGDLDLIMNGSVWLNDGAGQFRDTGNSLPDNDTSLGDVDGDGDLDAVVTARSGSTTAAESFPFRGIGSPPAAAERRLAI